VTFVAFCAMTLPESIAEEIPFIARIKPSYPILSVPKVMNSMMAEHKSALLWTSPFLRMSLRFFGEAFSVLSPLPCAT
jgi:hypothetical protein